MKLKKIIILKLYRRSPELNSTYICSFNNKSYILYIDSEFKGMGLLNEYVLEYRIFEYRINELYNNKLYDDIYMENQLYITLKFEIIKYTPTSIYVRMLK